MDTTISDHFPLLQAWRHSCLQAWEAVDLAPASLPRSLSSADLVHLSSFSFFPHNITPATGQVLLHFGYQTAFVCFLPLLFRKIFPSSPLSLQASPSTVHYTYWLIPLSPQYTGHHPHLYAFTFSNYFLSSCLSLRVFALPEFSPNRSILFLLYSFCVEKKIFCFLIKDTHYLIRSFISPSSFLMGLVYHQHFFLQISGEISLSDPPINSYGEQVLFCFLFFGAVANYQYSPLPPPLFMEVAV